MKRTLKTTPPEILGPLRTSDRHVENVSTGERRPQDSPTDLGDSLGEHRAWLADVIRRRLGSFDLVETVDDLLQEVALAVARSPSAPVEGDDRRAWLTRVALRRCASAIRSTLRRRRKHDGLRDSTAALGRANPTIEGEPSLRMIAEERRGLVRRSLADLAELDRRLLVWKYVDGLTYDAIVARCGLSRDAVEHRIVSARTRLRDRLRSLGPDVDA